MRSRGAGDLEPAGRTAQRKERRRLNAHLRECPSCAHIDAAQFQRRRVFKGLALLPLPLPLVLFKGAPSASAASGLPTIGAAAAGGTAGGSAGALAAGGAGAKVAAVVAAAAVAGGAGYEGVQQVQERRWPDRPAKAVAVTPASIRASSKPAVANPVVVPGGKSVRRGRSLPRAAPPGQAVAAATRAKPKHTSGPKAKEPKPALAKEAQLRGPQRRSVGKPSAPPGRVKPPKRRD